MLLKVNPNRMELLRLKKRLVLAKRGHKLLKDKRDALIQEFIRLVKETKVMREELEDKLMKCYIIFSNASSLMSKITLEETLMFPKAKSTIEVTFKNIMSVYVPKYIFKYEGNFYAYSLINTTPELDIALRNFYEILPLMLKLAELDKAVSLLAEEIEKTRRRVNALEYVLIPDLEETVKFITLKLDEVARSTTSAIMRIKEIIRA
ncbi:MAG: V-type ATP synthase subunit D [Candidatus Atribacteria bacterium]